MEAIAAIGFHDFGSLPPTVGSIESCCHRLFCTTRSWHIRGMRADKQEKWRKFAFAIELGFAFLIVGSHVLIGLWGIVRSLF